MPRPAPQPLTASPENRLEEKEEKEVRNTNTLENNTHVFNTNIMEGVSQTVFKNKTLKPKGEGVGAGPQLFYKRINPILPFSHLLPYTESSHRLLKSNHLHLKEK